MEAIGPLQLRVMHFIWDNGASTVHDVHQALNQEAGAPQLAYTTILTVMRNLARRKILNQKPSGRSHIFEPLIDEETYKLGLLQQIREDLFAGDGKRMLNLISRDKGLTPKTRKAIADIVG